MDEPSLIIEPLGPRHDRAAFSCGEPALDAYPQRRATQDIRRRVVRASAAIAIHVLIVDAKTERAQAFYQRSGLRAFASTPRRLFPPLETFEKLGL